MRRTTTFVLLVLALQIAQEIAAAPLQSNIYLPKKSTRGDYKAPPEVRKLKLNNTKKDVFVSRGWGAGGMPFSILYMNQAYSSKAPTVTPEQPYRAAPLTAAEPPEKTAPQASTAKLSRQKSFNKHHSVIPQLFVSYGWGPLGK